MADQTKRPKVKIDLPDDLEATYANVALISTTASEFIIDFARVLPNKTTAKIYSRVVLTPMNAKLLLHALQEGISRYESQFGEIPTPPSSITIDPKKGFSG